MNDFSFSSASSIPNVFIPEVAAGALGAIGSRSLVSMQPFNKPASVTPDGSKFFTDTSGDIIFAQYASGAIFIKQSKGAAVRTADGDYWMGNSNSGWHRVD